MSQAVEELTVVGRRSELWFTLRSRWLRVGVYLLLAAAVTVYAYWRMYTTFSFWDDEGYILVSVREFLQHGGLYTHVYSQYGPFPYEFWGGIFKLFGGNVTPDRARAFDVVIWVAVVLLIARTTERITGSLAIGLVTGMVAFQALGEIDLEPLTPDDLTCLLGVLLIATPAMIRGRRARALVVLGALSAAALTTKINIGGAMFLATCFAITASAAPVSLRGRALARLLIAAGVLMPVILMRPDLTKEPDISFGVAMAFGILALGLNMDLGREPATSDSPVFRDLKRFLTVFVLTTVLVIVIILATGTSVSGLIDGLVIWPLHLRSIFELPLLVTYLALGVAGVGLAWAILVFVNRRYSWRWSHWESWMWLGAVMRVIVAALILLANAYTNWIPGMAQVGSIRLALPFMWLAANPPHDRDHRSHRPQLSRLMCAALPMYAAIGIYPVDGSQYSYATTLFLPGAAVILSDGCRELRRLFALHGLGYIWLVRTVAVAFVGFGAWQALIKDGNVSRKLFSSYTPLDVPGATQVRQPPSTTTALDQITATLRSRCTNLIMEPGLDSFYLWTGIAPPTSMNAGDWMFLLSAQQQQLTVNAVHNIRRLCLVTNAAAEYNWLQERPLPNKPLVKFIRETPFKQILSTSGYTVSIRER